MMETVSWIVMFFAGGMLGLFYFGGLWFFVKKINSWKYPALAMSLSMLIRLVVTVAGFYWLTGGQWLKLVMTLTGFLVIRLILVRRYGPDKIQKTKRIYV
ncbi:MAG: ATP synthase subunit I [Gammaproteobacteria bacterium]|nr:ATP synthase subunit I [Gammaproteobacteria bacterium]